MAIGDSESAHLPTIPPIFWMIRESGREGGEEEEGNWTKTELGGKGGRRLVERVDHQQQQHQAVGGGKAHHRQEIFFFPLALRG